jgi:starvation-inducible outer membrane lipoprotein
MKPLFYAIFTAQSLLFAGCVCIPIRRMAEIPMVSTDEVLAHPQTYVGKAIELRGVLTTTDPKRRLWILDKNILIRPCSIDSISEVNTGLRIDIRGYFNRKRQSPIHYVLKSADYIPRYDY